MDFQVIQLLFNYIYKQPHQGSVYIYADLGIMKYLKFKQL